MMTVSALVTGELGRPLPAGYAPVPLNGDSAPGSPSENGAAGAWPLAVCLVVRTEAATGADPAGSSPVVVLRDSLDLRVFLGCVLDAGGCVQQWVEVWVQDIDGLADALPAYRDALSNAKLDQRWTRRSETMGVLGRARTGALIRTGFESVHPDPLLLDLRAMRLIHPVEGGSNGAWVLCTDDALLAGRGLAPYSSSLFRYLYVRELGTESFFIPVTRGAPTGERTISAQEALGVAEPGGAGDLIPVNLGGGLLIVCSHTALGYEAYADALTGLDNQGSDAGGSSGHGSVLSTLVSGSSGPGVKGAMLTLGRSGRLGRLLETFHLKLRLLADAVGAVRTVIEQNQLPLLNLTATSFGVRLGESAWGLPALWTARVVLHDAGEAVPMQVPGSDLTYFVASGVSGPTVYSSGLAGRSFGGQGTLQIRQVRTENGATVVEGTLRSHERFAVSVSDLVWLRFQISGVRFDLYGTPHEAKSGMVTGEMRVRTVPQRLGDKEAARLKSAEGVMLPGVMFETLSMASTPCDLFSIGVLAARTLLVDAKNTLAVALDEIQSLASQVAADHDPQVGLGLRIRTIIEGAPAAKAGKAPSAGPSRWLESVGPHHLVREPWEPGEALAAVTPELWCDTLGMIVRCLPAVGPDSVCRDFGDAPSGAIHRVFDRAADDLRDLLVRSRGMVVVDQGAGAEIRGILGRFLSGQKTVSGTGGGKR